MIAGRLSFKKIPLTPRVFDDVLRIWSIWAFVRASEVKARG